MNQLAPSTALGEDDVSSARRCVELKRLHLFAALSVGFVIVVAGGAIAGVLVLFDTSTNSSLRELALISILGGVIGGVGRNLVELLEKLSLGWQFADGSVLNRDEEVKRRRNAELLYYDQQLLEATPELPADASKNTDEARQHKERRRSLQERFEAHQEQARPSEHGPLRGYFDVHYLPFSLLSPLMGAILGFALFAGVTGGLLLASGGGHPSYSSTGLLFLAFLAGFFSETFLVRLASAADALFGVQQTGGRRSGRGSAPEPGANELPN